MGKPARRSPTVLEQCFGLDPFVAAFIIVIDIMLFGLDATGVGWCGSLCISVALIPACALMQRYNYGDNWGVSWAKSLMVGVLTAIPTPLPSFLTGTAGVVGLVKLLKSEPEDD